MATALAARGSAALDISKDYPESNFNVLIPTRTAAEIAAIHRPVISAVTISTNIADGDIYKQGYKYALTSQALKKLASTAGVECVGSEFLLPTTCTKCAEINKYTGKPMNCYRCGNKDVKCQYTVLIPQLTGQKLRVVATKELVFDDVSEGATREQKSMILKYRNELCETKALNRALRTALHIKATYTLEELSRPFIVAYLVPNLDHEDVKQAAIRDMFTASKSIFGVDPSEDGQAGLPAPEMAAALPELQPDETLYVEDNDPEDDAREVPARDDRPAREYPDSQEPPQTQRHPEEASGSPAQRRTQQSQARSGLICSNCGRAINQKVYDYSVRRFAKALCFECQKGGGGA